MTATMTNLPTILKLTGLITMTLFIGAARPTPRKATATAAPAQKSLASVATPKPTADVELLRDALPASATITPSNLTPLLTEAPAATLKTLRKVRMEVTAYCPCKKCCGPNAHGLTASGFDVSYNNSRFVAADTDRLPFGTRLIIPGYDAAPVQVIDRGSAIKGHKLDVYFPTHQQALQWGRQTLEISVVE